MIIPILQLRKSQDLEKLSSFSAFKKLVGKLELVGRWVQISSNGRVIEATVFEVKIQNTSSLSCLFVLSESG